MLYRIEQVPLPHTIPEGSCFSLALVVIGICIAMLVYCLVQLFLTFKDP